MFSERPLPDEVDGVREAHRPDALVLDCERDFETLSTEDREALVARVDDVEPVAYETAWLPADPPNLLEQWTLGGLVVGAPEDGSVAWTTQTTPAVVLVKPRVEGSPEAFVEFLVAEALVEAGLDAPERFLGFFGDRYPDLDAAFDAGPTLTYQIAASLYDAYRGLHTREVFRGWAGDRPRLYEAWADAGERLAGRAGEVTAEVARGDLGFADATELACSAVKHGLDLPAPFAALDVAAYREYGADYAVRWAEKVAAAGADDDTR